MKKHEIINKLLLDADMLGLKINYDKSEIFSVGVELAEQSKIASIFGCKVVQFPLTYLGHPVSDCKLSKAHLSYVGDIVRKRRNVLMD